MNIIEPACDLIEEKWKTIPALRKEYQRTGGNLIPRFFNNIAEWANGEILLEVRTGQAKTFRAVAIIVDAFTGEELGPRIVAKTPMHGRIYLLGGDYIAWLNFGESTVSVFKTPLY